MGIPERPTLGLPMPLEGSQYVITGITNGPGFTVNPCLRSQIQWAKDRNLWIGAYAVTTYPTPAELERFDGNQTDLYRRLWYTGAFQAVINVVNMRRAGNNAPMIWVDVEPSKGRPWSSDVRQNQAVVAGAIAVYQANGYRIGLYSYNSGWQEIMGNRRYTATPTWVPSGINSRESARIKCGQPSFSGGPVWLGQWTDQVRDFNITCPGVTGSEGGLSPLTPYMDTAIARGARGPAVVALQQRLRIEADGIFGAQTEAAVRAFQIASKIHQPNGVVTPGVWRTMGAGTTTPATASVWTKMFAPA